jgi:hypothetical protein
MMRPVVNGYPVRETGLAAGSRLRRLPSLTSLAFTLPVVLLYWQLGGPAAMLADPNTGVHVRAGEWILTHHAIPRQEPFSFTLASGAWCDWEWLSDVIYARLYRVHGLGAIVAFHLALLCLTSLTVYRTARLRVGETIAFGVTCLVMATTTIHWLARPHLLTWLFLGVFSFLVERADITGEHRLLLTLPVLMILWANLHPGFVAGPLILGAWCASVLLRCYLFGDSEDRLRHRSQALWLCLTLAVCLGATFANPYAAHLHEHILTYLFSSRTVTAHVVEWLPPDSHNPRLDWFELLLPLAAGAALWQGGRGHLAHCALVLGWMHTALASVRNVPLFAIVSAAPLAASAARLLRCSNFGLKLGAAEIALALRRSNALTVATYTLGLAALVGIFMRGAATFGPPSSLPIEAARHLPAGRLFTTDRWADYLIYTQPGRSVFFDCRNDVYGSEAVEDYLTVMRATPGWKSVIEKCSLSVALVPKRSAISAALSESRDWKLFYQDSVAAAFIRSIE